MSANIMYTKWLFNSVRWLNQTSEILRHNYRKTFLSFHNTIINFTNNIIVVSWLYLQNLATFTCKYCSICSTYTRNVHSHIIFWSTLYQYHIKHIWKIGIHTYTVYVQSDNLVCGLDMVFYITFLKWSLLHTAQ